MDDRPTEGGGPLYWLGRRSRRFWIAAAALVPVLYVVSFGPVWWAASRGQLPGKRVAHALYRPILWAVVEYEGPLRWWADLGAVPRGRQMSQEYLVIWHDFDIPYQPTDRSLRRLELSDRLADIDDLLE